MHYELREIMPDGTFRRLVALDDDFRPILPQSLPIEGEMAEDLRSMMRAELIHRTGWYLDSTEIPRELFERAWIWRESATGSEASDPTLPSDIGKIWAAGRSRRRR